MKPPVVHVLERDIIKDVRQYLKKNHIFYWRTPATGKSYFSTTGIADIIIVWKGKVIGLEIKRPGNRSVSRLSDAQQEWGKTLMANGGFYCIVTSVQEVEDIFHFGL